MNFKENLKALRIKKGYTQLEISQILNMSYNTYLNYEHGTREPSLPVLKKIKEALDCTYEDLLS